jgi:hypothetical protein
MRSDVPMRWRALLQRGIYRRGGRSMLCGWLLTVYRGWAARASRNLAVLPWLRRRRRGAARAHAQTIVLVARRPTTDPSPDTN